MLAIEQHELGLADALSSQLLARDLAVLGSNHAPIAALEPASTSAAQALQSMLVRRRAQRGGSAPAFLL